MIKEDCTAPLFAVAGLGRLAGHTAPSEVITTSSEVRPMVPFRE